MLRIDAYNKNEELMHQRHSITRRLLSTGFTILLFPGIIVAVSPFSDLGDLLHWFSADTNVRSDSAATTTATDGIDVLGGRTSDRWSTALPAAVSSARSPSYVSFIANDLF